MARTFVKITPGWAEARLRPVLDAGVLSDVMSGADWPQPGRQLAVTRDREEETGRVDHDARLPPDTVLPGIDTLAGDGDAGGPLDALGVDHAGRRFGAPSFLLT